MKIDGMKRTFMNSSSKSSRWNFHFRQDHEEICMSRLPSAIQNRALKDASPDHDPVCCSNCDRVFGNPNELVVHQRRYSGDQPYFCPKCGESFTTLPSLLLHRGSHKSRPVFHCKACRSEFSGIHEYTMHLDKCKTFGVFTCTCTRAFPSLKTLLCHMRLHERNRGIQCSVCPKVYANFKTVANHERHRHGKVRTQSWGLSMNIFSQIRG